MGKKTLGVLAVLLVLWPACSKSDLITVYFDSGSSIETYAVKRLKDHLSSAGIRIKENSEDRTTHRTVYILKESDGPDLIPPGKFSDYFKDLSPEGYQILIENDTVFILAKTDRGCLYGTMEMIEQLGRFCDFSRLRARRENPTFSFRAIKFNLPWAPYRPGPATELHKETCRDPAFWEFFLNMMVENRFNALTLWSAHLFPYMIRAENYPDATPYDDRELSDWQTFWKNLFRMAGDRGIETYLVNWNIVVSPEFAQAYGAEVHDDRSDLVKRYTRESVTQLINEYEDLTGLGVTLADWMGNWGDKLMTPAEREKWIDSTFVEGMKAADRKIKFIHRAVLAGDPGEMRNVIDHAGLPDKTVVEVKFNWSHGHSTPHLSLTHANDEGTIMRGFWDPVPENYFIAWMIRNEDFFVLRWGHPDFIREHMKINRHPYVDGYFVGSEGYIPAKDYSHREHPHKTWDYAFQKQWLFYRLWGRLAYNPEEKDEVLARAFENRYPGVDGIRMLKAYALASEVPLHLASFYKSTWDFTLYSEGFLAPWTTGYDDGKSPFISIEELIRHETLDARYLSIMDYCRRTNEGASIGNDLMTPLRLARGLQRDCEIALEELSGLRTTGGDPTLESELDDLETWCYLGLYFGEKLRAGVALENFNLTGDKQHLDNALKHLENGLSHWDSVIRMTADRYHPMPYVSMGHHVQKWPEFKSFHWQDFRDEVQADLDYVMSLY